MSSQVKFVELKPQGASTWLMFLHTETDVQIQSSQCGISGQQSGPATVSFQQCSMLIHVPRTVES